MLKSAQDPPSVIWILVLAFESSLKLQVMGKWLGLVELLQKLARAGPSF